MQFDHYLSKGRWETQDSSKDMIIQQSWSKNKWIHIERIGNESGYSRKSLRNIKNKEKNKLYKIKEKWLCGVCFLIIEKNDRSGRQVKEIQHTCNWSPWRNPKQCNQENI